MRSRKKEKDFNYYDGIYKSFDGFSTHYKNSGYYILWTQALIFMKRIQSPKILEIGCGTGQFAHYLYDEGCIDYHGFDFSPEAIRIAKKTINQSFSLGDALDKASYCHDYNLIISLEVLEHIWDDLRVLNNIKQGTYIIFSLPVSNDISHVRWFMNWREIEKRYYRNIDIKEIVYIRKWFVCFGTVCDFHPSIFNLIFKTRENINAKYIIHRVKNSLPAPLYRFLLDLKAFLKLSVK